MRSGRKPTATSTIFQYIAKDNLGAAIRFYEAAFHSFDVLLKNPQIGPVREFENSLLKDIRLWLVKGFEKYLIFYRATDETVEIVRVLHSARDIDSLMGGGEGD